jgi:hypothetical protein
MTLIPSVLVVAVWAEAGTSRQSEKAAVERALIANSFLLNGPPLG